MLAIAAAVLFALVQAQTAQAAAEKASAARRKAVGALVELDRVRTQTAEQLAACRTSTEQAQTVVRTARTELEEIRAAAAKAVAEVHEVADAAIQQVIIDHDRILAERAAELRQQIEQVKAEAQTQVKAMQERTDAAKADAERLIETMRGALADATNAATRAELDQVMVAQHHAQTGLGTARPHGLSERRKLKMVPELIDKAQRMYDSRRYTMAEIAQSCAVSSTTIYRYIHTGQPRHTN
ncbi:MAG: hypothetical protein ACRDQU_21245 [Pseudonocardiaceae bacterium]